MLLQTPDAVGEQEIEYTTLTVRDPTLEETTDLMFAWKVVRHVKSNAIVLAHKLAVVGVGAGVTGVGVRDGVGVGVGVTVQLQEMLTEFTGPLKVIVSLAGQVMVVGIVMLTETCPLR